MSTRFLRTVFASQLACLFSVALCGSTTVTGSSGLTTVNATFGSSGWQSADASALLATITYDANLSVISGSQNPHATEFKCVSNGVFGPKTLTGLSGLISDSSGSAGVSTSGNTQFSTPSQGIPQYYNTSWTTTTTTTGVGSNSSSGTWDPWPYTVGALQGLGIQPGDTIDFYFQVHLGAGSAILPGSHEAGQFSFAAYAGRYDSTTIPFLSAAVNRGPSGYSYSASQSTDANVSIYQLSSAVALDDTLTPGGKMALGTLMGPTGVHDAFGGDLSGIGAIINDLYFGVVVHNFVTPTGLGTNDMVFDTHFDTYSQVGPVPEPATLLVLGTGALLALLRRRAR